MSLKDKCCNLFSKAKSTIGGIFSSEVTKPVSRGKVITHLCKRVVLHTAQGMVCGSTLAYVDHIVESKMDDLGALLTDLIYSDIDEIDKKHPVVSSAIEVYNEVGKKKL